MKKVHPPLDSAAIGKDFNALCKKHNLPTALLVVERETEQSDKHNKVVDLMYSTKASTKKKEHALMQSARALFDVTGLDNIALEIASELMLSESKKRALFLKEQNLSKKDKARLKKIREEKHKCVEEKNYEKASNLRTEERLILGIEADKIVTPLGLDGVLNYHPSNKELEKITKMLTDSFPGWKLNK